MVRAYGRQARSVHEEHAFSIPTGAGSEYGHRFCGLEAIDDSILDCLCLVADILLGQRARRGLLQAATHRLAACQTTAGSSPAWLPSPSEARQLAFRRADVLSSGQSVYRWRNGIGMHGRCRPSSRAAPPIGRCPASTSIVYGIGSPPAG